MKNLLKYLIFLLIFLFSIIINNLEIKAQRLCDNTFLLNNIPISTTMQLAENSIAVNPNYPNIILCANNTSTEVAYFISTNWGVDWNGSVIDQGTNTGNSWCDPAVAIDLNGRLFVAYLTIEPYRDQKIAFSDDLGQNWTYRYIAYYNEGTERPDKDHLHIDNSCSSNYKGNIYCAWRNEFGAATTGIQISSSIDGGNNWRTPISIGQTNYNSDQIGVNICTDNSGIVYVVWGLYIADHYWNAIGFSKSNDGGLTWNLQTPINITYLANQNLSCEGPSLTCDLHNNNNNLFMVFSGQLTPPRSDYDVFMLKSTDGGMTWPETVVNQTTTRDQKFPWISCDPVTGYLACIYYDTRDDPNNQNKSTYFSISTNSGTSWCDMKISSLSWNQTYTSLFDDYIGLDFNKGIIYPIWSTTINNFSTTYVQPYYVLPKDSTIQDQTINGNHETVYSAEELTANNFIVNSGGNVSLESVNSITLNPGFEAQQGSNFTAGFLFCEPLNNSSKKSLSEYNINKKETSSNKKKNNLIPEKFDLAQNYPNPFNPNTRIQYSLKSDVKVNLTIYNILGQVVRTLIDEYQNAGFKDVIWDGINESGTQVSSGIYFYKIIAGDFIDEKKMVLIR